LAGRVHNNRIVGIPARSITAFRSFIPTCHQELYCITGVGAPPSPSKF
jgi:hypothetical protein